MTRTRIELVLAGDDGATLRFVRALIKLLLRRHGVRVLELREVPAAVAEGGTAP